MRLIIFRTPSSLVLKIPKVKFLKIGPSFVGMMRLVTGIGEGKKKYSGTRDNLDVFIHSMVNGSSAMLH